MKKSKSLLWQNIAEANRSWQGTRWKACSETRIASRSQQCTRNLDQRASHHERHSRTLDHWVGPVGIHHIVEECRILWKNRTQTTDYPSVTTTRPHANSSEPALHATAATKAETHQVTNEWNFCKRLNTHSSKLNISSKQYGRIRHPTRTGHFGWNA